jgi:hypothetical protein
MQSMQVQNKWKELPQSGLSLSMQDLWMQM